jgi:adenosine kinase
LYPGIFTASFFATTDHDSAQIASFYPGAMGYSATQSLKELDTNQTLSSFHPAAPDAMMKFPAECRELGIKYLYDPSQQVLRLEGQELARDMEGAYFLFCNDYEFGLISKKTGWSLDQILGACESAGHHTRQRRR